MEIDRKKVTNHQREFFACEVSVSVRQYYGQRGILRILVNFLHAHPSLPRSIAVTLPSSFPIAEGNILHVGTLPFAGKSEERKQNVGESE